MPLSGPSPLQNATSAVRRDQKGGGRVISEHCRQEVQVAHSGSLRMLTDAIISPSRISNLFVLTTASTALLRTRRVGIRAGQSDSPTRVRRRCLVPSRVCTEGSCSSTGPGSGSISSMSIVGRTCLSSRFTRYISGRTDSVLEISSNIWKIEMGSAMIKLISASSCFLYRILSCRVGTRADVRHDQHESQPEATSPFSLDLLFNG
jgi:hypothetical protein